MVCSEIFDSGIDHAVFMLSDAPFRQSGRGIETKNRAAVMNCPKEESTEESKMAFNIRCVSTVCESIINDPQTHADTIPSLIQALDTKDADYRKIVMLSLVKVFKNIVPFYKVRLHSNKVRGSGECAQLQHLDKSILHAYTEFVRRVVESADAISYKAACYLLESLDHFNLADRLVSKVLRGTLERSCVGFCKETLEKKIRESTNMELVHSIVNEMCELRFHPSVLPILLEINVFEKGTDESSVQDSVVEKKKRSRQRKGTDESNVQDSVEEKKKKALQSKIADGIIRICVSILRNKRLEFYEFVFCCLIKHKCLIRNDLFEGLSILLNEVLDTGDFRTKLASMQCILEIFSKRDYDFGTMVNTLFCIIDPGAYSKKSLKELVFLIRNLFVSRRQPSARARSFLQRLLQLCLIRHVPELKDVIEEMRQAYNFDYRDAVTVGSGVYLQNGKRIDQMAEKPFYEYFLYRRIA